MLSTLSITAPAPGMIYLNGRFAGEASDDAPLLLPVNGLGAMYLEYRPLREGWLPMARRIVLSHGRPVALPEGIFAILWPSRLLELELAPSRCAPETAEELSLDGLDCRLRRGSRTRLEIRGAEYPLPDDAEPPQLLRLEKCLALAGRSGEGQYLLTLSADASRRTGFLTADRLEWESGEILRATTLQRDVAGHATLERWLADESGLQLLSGEPVWEDGSPRKPASGEEAARAAIEAALLGKMDEADALLSPQLRSQYSLESIGDICQGCLTMKSAPPGGRACIGLLRMEEENFAAVHPLYYEAEKAGGEWLVTALEPDLSE